MNLGLILTARCNAACAHCSKSYGPHRTEHLKASDIFRLMEEAAAIDDGTPLCFDLTGGEPFLDFELLVNVVTHGADLGGRVTCVTNAYWARTQELATAKLTRLKEAGLSALSVSVSRFHQRFVPLHRARRALETAMSLGISTELKGAVTLSDLEPDGALSEWKGNLDADRVNIFPVLPCLRDEESLPDSEYYRESGLPTHACPGEIVSVSFDGIVRSCCGPGVSDDFLLIGDANSTPLEEIHRRFKQGGKQKLLRELGPLHFARKAMEAGLGDRLRESYAGPCDLCLHIRTDPELRQVAEDVSSVADQAQSGRLSL